MTFTTTMGRNARRLCLHTGRALPLIMPLMWAQNAWANSAPAVGSGALARMVAGLIIVVALILACAWVMRRSGMPARLSGTLPMKTIGNLAIGQRERIVVVEVEDTWLVVGVSQSGINTLHTLPARPLPASPSANGNLPNFSQALKNTLRARLRNAEGAASNRV